MKGRKERKKEGGGGGKGEERGLREEGGVGRRYRK